MLFNESGMVRTASRVAPRVLWRQCCGSVEGDAGKSSFADSASNVAL